MSEQVRSATLGVMSTEHSMTTREIAERSGYCRSSVTACLRSMEREQTVERTGSDKKTGYLWKSNQFQLFPAPTPATTEGDGDAV